MSKVAFQGEIGAYSEEAIFDYFKNEVMTIPCRNLSDVFQTVKDGKTNFGIVPIENSLGGNIGETLDTFARYNVKICGEVILTIDHCLIVNKGTRMKDIEVVYSHPQAIIQCRNFLEKHMFRIIPEYDTAGSVKKIRDNNMHNSAAIASARTAKIYDMKILKMGIQSSKHNYTRFFVISKKDLLLKSARSYKTSILFKIPHLPGSLHKSLEPFAKMKINILKLDSRPIGKDWKNRNWEYFFFLDFDGHKNEKHINNAILELKKHSEFLKILGSYPKAK